MRKSYENPGRASFSLVLYFLCHAQILMDPSTNEPPRETGYDREPSAQLCWSSGSSFPRVCNTMSWN